MANGTVDEELEVLLTLDNAEYVRRTRASIVATRDLDSSLSNLYSRMQLGAGVAKVFVSSLFAIDAAIIGAGIAASRRAADFESLELSLAAVEGGAVNAKRALMDLREIARGPGLGVSEAIETFTGLRRGGLGREMAMALTRELGNAVATSGGGKEILGRAGLALSQIALTPFLQGDELRQLSEAGIPGHKIIRDTFGTADTRELQKRGIGSEQVLKALLDFMEKMPRVAGGARNSLDNFFDVLDQGVISFGRGINQSLMPEIDGLGAAVERLTGEGGLEEFGKTLANQWIDIFDVITDGTGDTQEIMFEFMKTVLVAGYATKNFAMQIDDLLNVLIPPAGRKLFGGLKGTEGLDPVSLAERDIEGIRKTMELRKKLSEKGGDLVPEDVIADLGMSATRSSSPIPILKQIASHTKTMADKIQDLMVGGGAATEAAFSATNIGKWSNVGGSRGAQHILAGVQMLQGEAMVAAARNRSFNPQSR